MTRQVPTPWQALQARLKARGLPPIRELKPRPTEAQRLRRGYRWLQASRAYRRAHPLCEDCGERLSAEVHHRTPVSEAPERTFDPENLVALCRRCHLARHRTGPGGGG